MEDYFKLKSSLGKNKNPPFVMFTGTTLNERFTPSRTRCVFDRSISRIPIEIPQVKERIVFTDQRYVDLHTRFSSYKNGDWEKIQKSNSEEEYRKRLKQHLRLYSKRRRSVKLPGTVDKKLLDNPSGIKKPEKNSINLTVDDEVHNFLLSIRGTRLPVKCDSYSELKDADNVCVESSTSAVFKKMLSVKRTWTAERRNKFTYSKDRDFNKEFVTRRGNPSFLPSCFDRKDIFYVEQDVKKSSQITKEQLDIELDTYMAESKPNSCTAASEDRDIGAFVDEYLMEVEKSFYEIEEL